MKAWLTHDYGDMRLEEIDEPSPKPGWVKLQILVAQPSITEILLLEGEKTYGHDIIARRLKNGPAQLFGHEFSGRVVQNGRGAAKFAIGDRVAVRGSHPEGIVGFDYPGAFAEYGVFPESLLSRVPNQIGDSEAAAIQPLTDSVAAVHAGEIKLGDIVVVIGLGAIGMGCLQVARASGAAMTIGVAKRAESLSMARQLGADVTIDSTAQNAVETLLKLTGGRGADVVFECAGGPVSLGLAGNAALEQAAQMVRDQGCIVGVAFDGDAAILPYSTFRFRSIRYRFPSILSQKLFDATVGLVASGKVQLAPLIDTVLGGIESLPEAIKRTANKKQYGLINPAQIRISKSN
jgi:threonine dehydrogenase-like Zn-dependent dehydrogenase